MNILRQNFNLKALNPNILRRSFFGRKTNNEANSEKNVGQSNPSDKTISFEFDPKLFTPFQLKSSNIDQKAFESIVDIFAKSHPKITARFTKEISALYSEQKEVNFTKSEIQRLEEINKINEKKIHAVEHKIHLQIKEMEDIHERMTKEKNKEKTFAISRFAKDILEILDNIERSLTNLEKQKSQISEFGEIVSRIKVVQERGKVILEKFGITKMENIIGNPVNLNQHDIIASIPWPGKNEEQIIEVTQNGYFIGDRVLRAAKVVIVKNS